MTGRQIIAAASVTLALGLSAQSQSKPDYPIKPVSFTAVHLTDDVLGAAHRDQPHLQHSVGLRTVRAHRPRGAVRARGGGAARRGQGRQASARLSVRRNRSLQGDRRRVVFAERHAGSEARRVRRRPDREDRRGAGARRLHLHDADHRSEEPASLGRPRAVGVRARRQPRALRPRPPVRSRRRASPRHRQAHAARTSRSRPPICWSRPSVPASARPGRGIRSPRWRW